jgi:hypothetical protein
VSAAEARWAGYGSGSEEGLLLLAVLALEQGRDQLPL